MIVEKSIEQYNLTQLLLKREGADDSTKLDIDKEIKRRNVSNEQLERSLQELNYIKNQKQEIGSKPLPWYLKIAYIIAPLIPNNIFEPEPLERDLQKKLSRSNTKQKQEELLFRKIGLVIYLSLFMAFFIYLTIKNRPYRKNDISKYRTNEERIKHGIPEIPKNWIVEKDIARDVWTNESADQIKHDYKIVSQIREFDTFVNNSDHNKKWVLKQEFSFVNLSNNEAPWNIELVSSSNINGELITKHQPLSIQQSDSVLISWGLK
ncbi:MAG: hypothetical protein N4A71_22680 [Carboxylicivirga sp.]|jgi:hypothetical protein|nr:hypothetical protein [Carboxylicivirga sp.]